MIDNDVNSPRSRAVRDLLQEHAGSRVRVLDDHNYVPDWSLGPTRFRLQLFSALRRRSVVLVIQTDGQGTSLTNGAEHFASSVWARHCPGEPLPPIWIQHQYVYGKVYGPQLVDFTVTGPHTVRQPQFGLGVTNEELAELVGGPVDLGPGLQLPG
jgi:hypothetical protein